MNETNKKGGTRKVADLPAYASCRHPEHNPARMRYYESGIYEHTCPQCGAVQTFTVVQPASMRVVP